MRKGIAFGQSGWQGRLDEDLTEENILLVADALVRYLFGQDPSPAKITAAIGFDGRAKSREIASLIAKTISENGVDVLLSSGIIPTPVLSFGVTFNGCTFGIMVTGGDLPPEYNGIEFKGAYGGPLSSDATAQIESLLRDKIREPAGLSGHGRKEIAIIDFLPRYVAHLESLIDFSILRSFSENPKNNGNVLIDSMGGAGQTIIEDILVGCGWRAQTLFGTPESRFFDRRPESVPANLDALKYNVKVVDALFGIATDGDGGRCGIVDEIGMWLNAQETTLALLWHLHKHKQWKGQILKSADTTDKVLRVADHWNIPLLDIGMRNGVGEFRGGKTLLGSLGSGGYCYGRHLLDCDGILTGLFFAELVANELKPLDEIKSQLETSFGPPHYSTADKPCDLPIARRLMRILTDGPSQHLGSLGKYHMEASETRGAINGLKVRWGDCRWLILQHLPLLSTIRLHAEGESGADMSAILEVGQRCLSFR